MKCELGCILEAPHTGASCRGSFDPHNVGVLGAQANTKAKAATEERGELPPRLKKHHCPTCGAFPVDLPEDRLAKPPTIAELEAILEEDDSDIVILPNGEVRTRPQPPASDDGLREADEDFDRYREGFPFLCEAWDHLQGYVNYRAYGADDVGEARSLEWNTTAWRLNKLGQRIRGLMDREIAHTALNEENTK